MAGSLLPGTHWNESEFQGGHTALCGPNALAMLESAHSQAYVNTLTVYTRMLAAKRCDSNGASTMSNLELQAHADGFTKTDRLGWNGNGYAQSVWQPWIVKHLYAGAAILLETNNGQALKDFIRSTGEDATNLQYHFIGLIGHNEGGDSPTFGRTVPYGFICTDGCNNAVNPIVNGTRTRIVGAASTGLLFYYPLTVIAAARPGALLAIYPKAAVVPAPAPKPLPAPMPAPAPVTVTDTQKLASLLADLRATLTKYS